MLLPLPLRLILHDPTTVTNGKCRRITVPEKNPTNTVTTAFPLSSAALLLVNPIWPPWSLLRFPKRNVTVRVTFQTCVPTNVYAGCYVVTFVSGEGYLQAEVSLPFSPRPARSYLRIASPSATLRVLMRISINHQPSSFPPLVTELPFCYRVCYRSEHAFRPMFTGLVTVLPM